MGKKILIGIGVTLGVLLVLMILFVVAINWIVSSEKGNKEEILTSSQQSPKKALIVYQPGISDYPSKIAHKIAKGLNEGAYEVTLNYPGKHLSADISQYSLVVLGSPIYASQSSKALTNYMTRIEDSSSARVVLFSTGDLKETTELDVMEKSLKAIKPYKKVKFHSNAKEEGEKNAYGLGKELAKE